MATWGGSTVDNLESITEDGAAQDNDDDDDDDEDGKTSLITIYLFITFKRRLYGLKSDI